MGPKEWVRKWVGNGFGNGSGKPLFAKTPSKMQEMGPKMGPDPFLDPSLDPFPDTWNPFFGSRFAFWNPFVLDPRVRSEGLHKPRRTRMLPTWHQRFHKLFGWNLILQGVGETTTEAYNVL